MIQKCHRQQNKAKLSWGFFPNKEIHEHQHAATLNGPYGSSKWKYSGRIIYLFTFPSAFFFLRDYKTTVGKMNVQFCILPTRHPAVI